MCQRQPSSNRPCVAAHELKSSRHLSLSTPANWRGRATRSDGQRKCGGERVLKDNSFAVARVRISHRCCGSSPLTGRSRCKRGERDGNGGIASALFRRIYVAIEVPDNLASPPLHRWFERKARCADCLPGAPRERRSNQASKSLRQRECRGGCAFLCDENLASY